jgi:methyltransferase family protein
MGEGLRKARRVTAANTMAVVPATPSLALEEMLAHPEIRMAIMRPIYLARSAWLEHIPFAFWITQKQRPKMMVELGTHYGPSYFAFCQAIQHLSLNARCYAVDTWKGDEHSGLYGEEVFRAVKAHNDQLYSRFSSLVRSTFDQAQEYFPDNSIDLLHIDGLHTLESVQHDFETWLPKLSERAIVMLHDTNVRERGFGVSRFVDSLRKLHPVFEFDHGHGLAVVAVGRTLQPGMQGLFEPRRKDSARRDFAEFFARLGRACADAYAVRARDEVRPTLASEPLPPSSAPHQARLFDRI